MEAPSLAATKPPSHLARFSRALGVASVLLFVVGPATIQLGVASPFIGFRAFTLGILFSLLALVLGAIALWRTRDTVALEDVDLLDCRDGHASQEDYLIEAKVNGITTNRRRVFVTASVVISGSMVSG